MNFASAVMLIFVLYSSRLSYCSRL